MSAAEHATQNVHVLYFPSGREGDLPAHAYLMPQNHLHDYARAHTLYAALDAVTLLGSCNTNKAPALGPDSIQLNHRLLAVKRCTTCALFPGVITAKCTVAAMPCAAWHGPQLEYWVENV